MRKRYVNKKTIYNYSLNFKRKVVAEIEKGELTLQQARLKYDIKGRSTIQRWIKKLGKNELLCKKVRIEMPDEIQKIKQLEARIAELKEAMVAMSLEKLSTEKFLELACEDLNTDPETYKKKVDGLRK